MANSDHGIVKDERAEDQPADKQRAQTAHSTDQKGSPSREATRDPRLNDNGKTPGSGMTPDDSGAAPSG
ncbi:hypothetical protein JQ621_21410 [Bradyrhizobium manausense]|uniref:hypothetical protein n=1 Tax=Bradyrhizobium manausense TaxID=989370 RepID=UPI001BA9195B|nr:hypothetical protein [Bradyrhizobium manausense]MBR1090029.1 hypothetical protein [Bradyrhizobium manausense]